MRAVLLQHAFGQHNLTLTETAAPDPGPGQVLVRLSAVSLNYRDLLMVQGSYNPKLGLPLIVLSDGVGRVEALGDGVQNPGIGTRVCPLFAPDWHTGDPPSNVFSTTLGGPRDGTFAEFIVVDQANLVEVPDYLSDVEAACLPCAALTAYSALFTLGCLQPGQHVLCLGTGAVSLFALQFAKAQGASVTITSKSDEKLSRARALGADHTINYQNHPNFGRKVRTEVGLVDHVIEVGGAATLDQSLAALRPGGTASLIGILAGHQGPINLTPILMRQLRVQGVFVGHKHSFQEMLNFMSLRQISPVIGSVFEMRQFDEAFSALAAQGHFGKICAIIR
jgi:NADPH:quinone reductase-like Zn-dependent oxidoreductase